MVAFQRFAYAYYMLIYYHVMLLMVPTAYKGDKKWLMIIGVMICITATYFYMLHPGNEVGRSCYNLN